MPARVSTGAGEFGRGGGGGQGRNALAVHVADGVNFVFSGGELLLGAGDGAAGHAEHGCCVWGEVVWWTEEVVVGAVLGRIEGR